MQINILTGISSLIKNNLYSLDNYKTLNHKIRINNAGEGLESLIKDILCDGFNLDSEEKIHLYEQCFSYLGNQNNPPDLIIKNGDAFEIKKIESKGNNIALNSSFPKDKLYRNSNMLTKACRDCEVTWQKKDICYVIGYLNKQQFLQSLWFVYGDCYCATADVYANIKEKMINAIQQSDTELSVTKEIAKIKKIDPLGITDLRVRGMWAIKHPDKVFEYITQPSEKPCIKVLMLKSKFESFSKESISAIHNLVSIKYVKIQNPNNPANLLDAVLVEYIFEHI